MTECVIGVDLGGTNVRACAFYKDGTPAGVPVSHSSRAQEGTDPVIDAIGNVIEEAKAGAKGTVRAVGMSVPGHIDGSRGIVVWAPNFGKEVDGVFHYWENVPLGRPLSDRTGMPIKMDNDANLAALGEYKYGSGRNSAKCLVMLTVGTGIGGGVIMGTDSVRGPASGPVMLVGGNKGGAELGHTLLLRGGHPNNAGSYGSLEAYCQRDSIIARAVTGLRRGRVTVIRDLCGGDYSKVTPYMISQAADKQDEFALEVWTEVGEWLGAGIGSLINVFAPDVFAIGGQITLAGEYLLGPARRVAREVAIPSLFKDARIVPAEQLEDAGMLGAAAIAWE